MDSRKGGRSARTLPREETARSWMHRPSVVRLWLIEHASSKPCPSTPDLVRVRVRVRVMGMVRVRVRARVSVTVTVRVRVIRVVRV